MMLSAPATLLTGLVTLLAVLVTIGTAMLVARVRTQTGVLPPAMSGHPSVERALRVQGNTVESFIVFLPALWLAALYFQGWAPPIIGLVWCLGRILYALTYKPANPDQRFAGFALTVFPTIILAILALVGIVNAWIAASA